MASQHIQKLSATKQKMSLGEVKKAEKAKQATNRKVVRTSVINPNDMVWPDISTKNEAELLKLLTTELQCLKFPKYHIPLSEIREVEQSKRNKFRHIWITEKSLSVGFDVASHSKHRKDVSLGVNCVSTALEQNGLAAVIIEKDVDPPILTRLLIPLAKSRNVPIVAVSGLNSLCQTVISIRCIAIGFKVSCTEFGHAFSRIVEKITTFTQIEENPVPDAYSAKAEPKDNNNKRARTPSSSEGDQFIPPKIRRF